MKRENKVITVTMAKKLYKLGFRLKSSFYWTEQIPSDNSNTWPSHIKPKIYFFIEQNTPCGCYTDNVYQGKEKYYAAYDVAELGELLKKYGISFDYTTNNFKCILSSLAYSGSKTTKGETEAIARGKMLIWLIETNQFKIKKQRPKEYYYKLKEIKDEKTF